MDVFRKQGLGVRMGRSLDISTGPSSSPLVYMWRLRWCLGARIFRITDTDELMRCE